MSDGLSLLDLMDMPPAWRTVMRLLMREKSMRHGALASAIANLPEDQRLSEAELGQTMDELCGRGYLSCETTPEGTRYELIVARKQSRKLSSGIWNALGVETDTDAPAPPRRSSARSLTESIGEQVEKQDTPPQAPPRKRTTGLLDALTGESDAAPEAPPRKRTTGLLDALTGETDAAPEAPPHDKTDGDETQ